MWIEINFFHPESDGVEGKFEQHNYGASMVNGCCAPVRWHNFTMKGTKLTSETTQDLYTWLQPLFFCQFHHVFKR